MDLSSCVRMVVAGRVDAFTALTPLAAKILTEQDVRGLVRSDSPVAQVTLSLIAPRNRPGSVALIERFNTTLRQMKADGSYKKVLEGS